MTKPFFASFFSVFGFSAPRFFASCFLVFGFLAPRFLVFGFLAPRFLVFGFLAFVMIHAQPAFAQHGLSLFGAPKYKEAFNQLDYVSPKAVKGGRVRLGAFGGFDSLNPFIIKGRVPQNLGLIYDRLMKASLDEPSSSYGLVALKVELSPRAMSFILNPKARFGDNHPITADDVIWTFNQLRAHHPFYQAYYRHVSRVEKISPLKVRFHFDSHANKELPFILGQLPVLPEHYWNKKSNDFSKTTLNPPLGSGPYFISALKAGQSITYKRRKDYWAKDLPINRLQNNIDEIRVDYFKDLSVAFEAFKAKNIDFYIESRAANWALGYQGIKNKNNLIREEIADKNPSSMQAFVLNIRRKRFADKRVRRALNYAFDFEWMNKHFFYNAYKRSSSYFEGSELAQKGLPKGKERALLMAHREDLPKEIFTKPITNPKTKGDGHNRQGLRQALLLLKQAGWQIKNNRLTHIKTNQIFHIEFLLVSPSFKKIILAYQKNLEKLGIEVSVQIVDSAQYSNRLRDYDFDAIIHNFPQSLSPGNEQRDFWHSESANISGGRNLIGIQNAVIDDLIDKIIHAPNRLDLIAATRALDRVLLWEYYVIPQWHIPYQRIAFWKPLSHPQPLPAFGLGFPEIWWVRQ